MRDRPGRPRVMVGTGFLVVSPEDRLLIVQQEHNGLIDWGFNGGALEAGETIQECVVRECNEELGLRVHPRRLIAVDEIWQQNLLQSIGFVFLVEPDPWPQEISFGQEDVTKFLAHRWVNKDEFESLRGEPEYDFWNLPWPLEISEPMLRRIQSS
jgi:ADP-ribose pyrophosphatase YjhB (NUDIX family)